MSWQLLEGRLDQWQLVQSLLCITRFSRLLFTFSVGVTGLRSSRCGQWDDDELNNFFDLAGNPTIFVWSNGSPSLSPASLPSEIVIPVLIAESVSESSGSSCSYLQTLFWKAVRKHDGNKCVLSSKEIRPKAGNVEAAHIFGIEPSLSSQWDAAGVVNAYDTCNEMLLEKSLHVAFDAYYWCMDESLVVHVSEEGKCQGLQQWDGKKSDSHSVPPSSLLESFYRPVLPRMKERHRNLVGHLKCEGAKLVKKS